MAPAAEAVSNESLRRLHSQSIDRKEQIRALLARAQQEGVTLESRLSRDLARQSAQIDALETEGLRLRTEGFDPEQPAQIFLNLALDGRRYFFSVANRSEGPGENPLPVGWPATIFFAERRERERRPPSGGGPSRVALGARDGRRVEAEVTDCSTDGLLVAVQEDQAAGLVGPLGVTFLDGPEAGAARFGVVRHERAVSGWRRIGLSVSSAPRSEPVAPERRDSILADDALSAGRRRWTLLRSGAVAASSKALRQITGRKRALPKPRIVEFHDARGERLTGIVDACGDPRGAPLVLIPPAWAKTKETLLPLARTIVASFERAGESVAVVRLDGIRRRGESHNDPECRTPGHECHHMTFGQGVSDIRAALSYFEKHPAWKPSRTVLVTFSGAAIEARKALVEEPRPRVGGWVSVVGAADLKTGLRVVSGGVDFIGGRERGVSFGIQRVLGIEVDMDRVGDDALAGRMAYLEDARCDMAKLEIPITWIQGRYDAWIDPERVGDMLACGDASQRRLIDVPTGHQLRSSNEALEVFQLIAEEVGRVALGRHLSPTLPDLGDLERRRTAERARLPKRQVDLRSFWQDYLLGRGEMLGMEILTVTRPYRELLERQVEALALAPGQRVADLGAGAGAFPTYLAEQWPELAEVEIHEFDYVREALRRAGANLSKLDGPVPRVRFIECDLDLRRHGGAVPAGDGTYDRVLASLLFNYVTEPGRLLAECHRLLLPGGRLVLSTLRRDADISRIYNQVAEELHAGRALEVFGAEAEQRIDESLRSFLNEAARLIDLEEAGVFQFWNADELTRHVEKAGFRNVRSEVAFGDPPQAIVVSAERV